MESFVARDVCNLLYCVCKMKKINRKIPKASLSDQSCSYKYFELLPGQEHDVNTIFCAAFTQMQLQRNIFTFIWNCIVFKLYFVDDHCQHCSISMCHTIYWLTPAEGPLVSLTPWQMSPYVACESLRHSNLFFSIFLC